MSSETDLNAARLEIGAPRRITTGAVLVICAYGLLLLVPVLLAMMAVSVVQFGGRTFVVPLLTLIIASFFLPIGFGNPHVKRLVRSQMPAGDRDPNGFIVQATLNPRLSSGLRAVVEDADDFGYLRFTGNGLIFQGDSIKATIPFDQIRQVQRRSIGWHGLFLCRQRIALVVPAFRDVQSIEFAERSSWIIPGSRRITQRLYDQLCAATAKRG